MPTDNSTLDKAINLRQLQMAHEDLDGRMVQLQETVDPASADVINEYQRVLAALYQALTDAQAVITPAEEGAAAASGAAAFVGEGETAGVAGSVTGVLAAPSGTSGRKYGVGDGVSVGVGEGDGVSEGEGEAVTGGREGSAGIGSPFRK